MIKILKREKITRCGHSKPMQHLDLNFLCININVTVGFTFLLFFGILVIPDTDLRQDFLDMTYIFYIYCIVYFLIASLLFLYNLFLRYMLICYYVLALFHCIYIYITYIYYIYNIYIYYIYIYILKFVK